MHFGSSVKSGNYWLLWCEGKVLWPLLFKRKIMPSEGMHRENSAKIM
jgi:hypothetical protein